MDNVAPFDPRKFVHDQERINTAVASEQAPAEPPRPLIREMPPADPFPVTALGDVLGGAARAIHEKTQAPIAIAAQSVLAAATLAAQGHADVTLPTGHVRPTSAFFVTVAASGERKSACDHEALWPIRKREAALREEHSAAAVKYRDETEAWEDARKKAKTGKRDFGSIGDALKAVGPEPSAPLTPMLTMPEPTFEGLCKFLAVG